MLPVSPRVLVLAGMLGYPGHKLRKAPPPEETPPPEKKRTRRRRRRTTPEHQR